MLHLTPKVALGRMAQLFGDEMDQVIEEMNEALAGMTT